MFKNIRLALLTDMFLNSSFKMTTSFAYIHRTTASTSKFIYRKRFQIIRFCLQNSLQSLESLFLIWYEKWPIYGNLK